MPNRRKDLHRHRGRGRIGAPIDLVLPKPQHGPALLAQASCDLGIAFPGPCEFLRPKVGVIAGPHCVLGAAVPETAIDKNREAGAWEGKIGPARNRQAQPVSETELPNRAPEMNFRPGVPAAVSGHAETALRRGQNIAAAAAHASSPSSPGIRTVGSPNEIPAGSTETASAMMPGGSAAKATMTARPNSQRSSEMRSRAPVCPAS